MRPILSEIHTFSQHIFTYLCLLEDKYKPQQCPHCGFPVIWNHGTYPRKPDRIHNSQNTYNDLHISRYLCADQENCGKTCSTLPECLAPRRWYPWINQQWLLYCLLLGWTINQCDQYFPMSRSTILRWKKWLDERTFTFHTHLKNKFPEFGYFAMNTKNTFWLTCFEHYSLSHLMLFLNNQGLIVP